MYSQYHEHQSHRRLGLRRAPKTTVLYHMHPNATFADKSHSMQAEIERLERNMGRRQARERAKGIGSAASPSAAASPGGDGADGADAATPAPTGKGKGRSKKNTEGTARKCANCGQVGHIKTNKKSASDFFCSDSCKKEAAKTKFSSETTGQVTGPRGRKRKHDSNDSASTPLTNDWLFADSAQI